MPQLVDINGNPIGTNANPIVVAKLKKTTTYGSYYLHSGNLTILAAAHAPTVGFIYIYNPVSSLKIAKFTFMKIDSGMTTALATPTAPCITVEKGTFTGIPTGAVIPVAKGDSADIASVLYISAASTGAVNGPTVPMNGKIIDANATVTANTPMSSVILLQANQDIKDFILKAGEYLVIRQADAGTTADTRKAIFNAIYEEYI